MDEDKSPCLFIVICPNFSCSSLGLKTTTATVTVANRQRAAHCCARHESTLTDRHIADYFNEKLVDFRERSFSGSWNKTASEPVWLRRTWRVDADEDEDDCHSRLIARTLSSCCACWFSDCRLCWHTKKVETLLYRTLIQAIKNAIELRVAMIFIEISCNCWRPNNLILRRSLRQSAVSVKICDLC